MPTLQGVLIRTGDRLKSFIVNAGKIIVPMVLVLNFLNALGTDGSFGRENTNQSVLSEIGRKLTFAFEPMGIAEDNWVATVGIFTGVLAKEAVVGTLDALYGQLENQTVDTKKPEFNLQHALTEAALTVPKNLSDVANRLLDPLGLNVGNLENSDEAATAQNVKTATFTAMQHSFDGQAGAFAYLLFILLYTPCVAATAAIYRETSAGWAAFTVAWTTGIAYFSATLFYQTATFSRHPEESLMWILGLAVLLFTVIFEFWLQGQREAKTA